MRKMLTAIKWLLVITLMSLYLIGLNAGGASSSSSSSFEEQVTYSKDIAPIFNKNCVTCHRPGNIAPMSLLTYKDAQPWARWIREKVVAREMPPWHADSRYGEFANARLLSQQEIAKIVAWVNQGASEGDPKDLPPTPQFPAKWEIGQPDVVLTMPEDTSLGTEGVDKYLYYRVPTNFKEDRWIQAVEFRPGNPKIVHHAVAFIEPPDKTMFHQGPSSIELMDGTITRVKPDAPIINDGCRVENSGTGGNNDSEILSVYAPGREPDVWPAGTAKKIPAGSNIIFQMHYSKSPGQAEKDRTSIALTFAKAPVERMVGTRSISNSLFLIPPGADNHEVTACWTFQRDIQVLSFMPHMHIRGKDMKYEVIYPDGRRETLLSVPRYIFHWQTLYTLKKPLAIPGGAKFIVTAHFNNSSMNMHNPDATKAIRHGSSTYDEMMIGFVNYTVPKPLEQVVVKLDPQVLDRYVGSYQLAPNAELEVLRSGSRLFVKSQGKSIEIFPLSETTFFSKDVDSQITFIKNDKGEVTEFIVTLFDQMVRLKRINRSTSTGPAQ
jgi:Domain of unknown function (DUF3471)/Copper type II ascorbate-dependent monooxygenase, C-terminal domain